MPDREKVIKGLECCIPSRNEEERKSETWYRHQDCPYRPYANGDYGCFWELMTDALALLKEQPEIVRCKDCKHGSLYCTEGVCGETLIECNRPDLGDVIEIHKWNWFCADGERKE